MSVWECKGHEWPVHPSPQERWPLSRGTGRSRKKLLGGIFSRTSGFNFFVIIVQIILWDFRERWPLRQPTCPQQRWCLNSPETPEAMREACFLLVKWMLWTRSHSGLQQQLNKPEKGRGAGGRQGRCPLPPGAGRQAGKTCKESNLQPPENKCTSSAYTPRARPAMACQRAAGPGGERGFKAQG